MATYRRSIIWHLACDPDVRLWSGAVRDLPIPGEGTFTAAGALIDIPALKTMMNGLADRVDFTVSGVSAATLRLAMEERESVQGAVLRVGRVYLDENYHYQRHEWTWRGVADVLTVDSQATETGRQRTIHLSVAAGDTLRANPQITRYTDADQRRRSPTDHFFDRVAGIAVGNTRRFGPK